jgi:hypothetical protein
VNRVWQRRFRYTYARRLDRVTTREELPAVLNARGLVGAGVEIGVKAGAFSAYILGDWKGARLISIDHWVGEHERHFETTKKRLSRFGMRSEIWRLASEPAAELVEDGSLDFVYIDAAHDRESVSRDLAAWFPKVRPGGIIAGHDYIPDRGNCGVKTAVDDFFGARGLRVETTRGIVSLEVRPSWIVQVEEGVAKGP